MSYFLKQSFDCLIRKLKTAWPTKISMSFLSSLDAYTFFFSKSVDNFEITHKTC